MRKEPRTCPGLHLVNNVAARYVANLVRVPHSYVEGGFCRLLNAHAWLCLPREGSPNWRLHRRWSLLPHREPTVTGRICWV
jgi:hypothetical protein